MSALVLPRPATAFSVWPRVQRLAPGAFVALAATGGVLRPALDYDLGWHLHAGELILTSGLVPRVDSFSHTMAGHPWVDNEWLWEAGIAALNGAYGVLSLIVVNALATALALVLVYATLRARLVSPLLASVGALLGLEILAAYADVRPGTAGVVGIAAFLYLLERYRGSADWRWPAALIPVEAVWANMHGSYVIGIIIVVLFAVACALERTERRTLVTVGTVALAIGATTLANPIGFGLTRFTLFASRLTFNREVIEAWKAPSFSDTEMLPLFAVFLVILGLAVFSQKARLPKFEVLLFLASGLAVMQSKEFVPLFAIVGAPLAAQMAQGLLPSRKVWRPAPTQVAILLAAALTLVIRRIPDLTEPAYQQALDKQFPVEAARFITGEHLAGPMWNAFNWGGYLQTAVPGLPVLVDSRTEMYGDAFLYDYQKVASGQAPYQPDFSKYGIRLVLIETGSPLARYLLTDASWRPAYRDKMATVFIPVQAS